MALDINEPGTKAIIIRTGDYSGFLIESRRPVFPDDYIAIWETVGRDPYGLIVYEIDATKPGAMGTLSAITPDGHDLKYLWRMGRQQANQVDALFNVGNTATVQGVELAAAYRFGAAFFIEASIVDQTARFDEAEPDFGSRDFYRTPQQFMIGHFVEPVFRRWLQASMTSGDLPLPMVKFEKFAENMVFRPRGFSWVDPLKEINANIVGLQNGVLSLQDVAAHYGRDVEEVFEAVERERELADRHGITLAFQPFGEKKPAEPIVE